MFAGSNDGETLELARGSTTVLLVWDKMERTEIGAALTEGLCSNPMRLSIIEAT